MLTMESAGDNLSVFDRTPDLPHLERILYPLGHQSGKKTKQHKNKESVLVNFQTENSSECKMICTIVAPSMTF